MKTCRKCGVNKPLTEYYKHNHVCKACKIKNAAKNAAKRLASDVELYQARQKKAERLFMDWAKEEGIVLSRLTHGELYKLKQEYNGQVRKFEHHVAPTNALPPRMDRRTATHYYNLKLHAVQLDTFEAWEMYRMFCKKHNMYCHERESVA